MVGQQLSSGAHGSDACITVQLTLHRLGIDPLVINLVGAEVMLKSMGCSVEEALTA